MSINDQTDGIPGQAIPGIDLANVLDDTRVAIDWLVGHHRTMPPCAVSANACGLVTFYARSSAEYRALGAWFGEDLATMDDITSASGALGLMLTRHFGRVRIDAWVPDETLAAER